MVNSFCALPCLLLLFSCAGSKSEYCEPNFASRAQRWPLANDHDSYEFLRILEVLLVASRSFFVNPVVFKARPKRTTPPTTRPTPGTTSEWDLLCGHPFHLYNSLHATSRCIEAHIWSRCEILLDLSFKSSKLRSTVAQFVNAILQKHCLPTQFPRPSWSSLSIYWDSVWDEGCWGLWKAHCPDTIKWNHFWHWSIQGVHIPYTGGPAISTVNISRSCAARVDLPIVIARRLFPSKFELGNQWTKQRNNDMAKTRPSPVTLEMQKIGQAWPSWRNSHTTVVRASAKIKASLSAFEKVDMTMY